VVELNVDGRTYRVISLDDLIRPKETLRHGKDLLVAHERRVVAARKRPAD